MRPKTFKPDIVPATFKPDPVDQPPKQDPFAPTGDRFERRRKVFAKLGARREAYQTDALKARLEQEDISAHGLDRNRMTFDAQLHSHNILKFSSELNLQAQELQTEVLAATAELAINRGLSLQAYDQVRVIEETKEAEFISKWALDTLELAKKREDKQIDIAAAMRYHLVEKEKALFLKDTILKLIAEQHRIMTSDSPLAVKESQAQLIGEVIGGFTGALRGYLQNDDGENVRGSDADSDGGPKHRSAVPEDKE